MIPMDLFRPNVISNQITSELFVQVWKQLESVRIRDAQKLYDWYYNDRYAVQNHVRLSLEKTFKATTVKRMNLRGLNIVERTISKLAQVYKDPAVRSLDGGLKEKVAASTVVGTAPDISEVQSPADKTYQELVEGSTIAKKAKEWHKLGRLFNTVLVQPVWQDEGNGDGHMDFMVHTPAWTVVETDPMDYRKATGFYYPIWNNDTLNPQQVLVYWNATQHYLVNRINQRIPSSVENSGMVNPYGIVPIAVLRFKDGIDFWGNGMWDLVEGNEEICVQLANLFFVTLFQTHGQPVAVNMNLPVNVRLGPDAPLTIDNAEGASSGKAPPNFFFATSNPTVAPVRELVDWLTHLLPAIKGLGAAGVQIQSNMQSGVSKMVDSTDVQEQREDDILVLEDFEHDLYEVTRVVWNYHNGGKQINDTAEFSVKFATPKVIKSADEKVKERDSAIKLGTASRVDMILEDNPQMSREQAVEKLQQILAENRQFDDKYGLFADETPKPDPNAPPPPPNGQGNLMMDQGGQTVKAGENQNVPPRKGA